MKLLVFIIFTLNSLLLNSEAQPQIAGLTQINNECRCKTDINDALEEPQSFNFGKFKGACIDSCRFRPARILSQIDNKNLQNKIIVGNILHFGEFYKATIYLDSIQVIETGFEEFLPRINHVFLQFHLKKNAPPILLQSQTDPKKAPVPIRSLVISAEGVPPKNHKYSIFESYFGHYLLAYRLVSGDEMHRWTKQLKHSVRTFPLDVEPSRIVKIFRRGLELSENKRIENVYQLFTNNCSTAALSLIDTELQLSSRVRSEWTKLEEAMPIASLFKPVGTLRALIDRKLIAESAIKTKNIIPR